LEIGDEILVLDGRIVSDLDFSTVQRTLSDHGSVCLTIRTSRINHIDDRLSLHLHSPGGDTINNIETLVCPPPPPQQWIDDKTLGFLTIPAPHLVTTEGVLVFSQSIKACLLQTAVF